MGTIKCDWCDRYFNHNCKDCRELNTHLRQLRDDLRKLVVEMRTKTSGIVPSGVWANKLEKLLDGGE